MCTLNGAAGNLSTTEESNQKDLGLTCHQKEFKQEQKLQSEEALKTITL